MAARNRPDPEIRTFILDTVESHPKSIVAIAAKEFGVTRMAIGRYMARLQRDGLVTAHGATKGRSYQLATLADFSTFIRLGVGISEDAIWRFRILPHLKDVNQNIIDICQYGFTEMLNNAIDHSASDDALISVSRNYKKISMIVADRGIGIFQKIQRDFGLPDPRSALLELSKGKLTSDKKRHAGEGIFFTSRMFDKFSIVSASLYYSRERQSDDDWLIEVADRNAIELGTILTMEIATSADWTTRSVFKKYQGDSLRFRRTHVPIKIGAYPGEQLVSRSQAKRILARFDNFSEVLLDFSGVEHIGQPFADEIFRVFPLDHPAVALYAIHTNEEIDAMIRHVRNAGDDNDRQPRFL